MITIADPKGGDGRSVTAVNLAASLALLEKKTLLVDCDPRACATVFAGLDTSTLASDLGSVLFGEVAPSDAVQTTQLRFMDLLPASFNLFHAASRLALNAGNERILRIFLRELRTEYEYMIIDSPASYNFLTVTALAASDWLVAPFQCTSGSIGDFTSLLRMVRHVRSNFQARLKIAGLLFTQCSSREEIDRFIAESDLNGVEGLVYKGFVPRDDALMKAAEEGKPVALYDVESPGARAYLDVAKEVISSFN
ncbi:MAG: ParA family protein [Desulfobacterium sp.]|nr:ParA family protein [Desulfobacterium sp.]